LCQLGRGNSKERLESFAKTWLGSISCPLVLIWNRAVSEYQTDRNTSALLRRQLSEMAVKQGLFPVFMGHKFGGTRSPSDLTNVWEEVEFSADPYRHQLWFVHHLRERHRLVGQVGSRSGGMDGHALLGLPTIYFDDSSATSSQRMHAWSGSPGKQPAIPHYRCVVLDDEDDASLACMTTAKIGEVEHIVTNWPSSE
jgi:hypothetical protein